MAKLPLTIAPGHVLTAAKAEVLRQLALAGEGGSCAVPVIMPGGTLAALVQFGLVEHAPDLPNDHLGGRRYRVNDAGRAVLKRLRLAA
ncbi:MAG: hypothetical protein K2X61_08260 [Caulobacteraceae bacterium]|nr:hypothetical protein [Caulobacteraceae bacterium]